MKYKVVLEAQEECGYTVYVPALPGCCSQGETVEEAISLYLESYSERKIALPHTEDREVAV